jgi:hypothetical protein
MKPWQPRKGFVVCIENKDTEDLELRKIYQVIVDREAKREGYLRAIAESGADYLYPANYFVAVELPLAAERTILRDTAAAS